MKAALSEEVMFERLKRNCPKEFLRADNPWHKLSLVVYKAQKGAEHTFDWTWRTTNPTVKYRQYEYVRDVLSRKEEELGVRLAVAGWLLSKFLRELP